jgi:dihydroorotate dehydrogenase
MYKFFIKPILFCFSPERAHHLTMLLFQFALKIPLMNLMFKKMYYIENQKLVIEKMGLRFPNPVGLAAGFDKDGKYYQSMSHLGFGFIEIGTVTPKGQDGNPTPRLFRLPEDEALINRMGFNNEGADILAQRLATQGKPENCILGINIGKNKVTPNEDAVSDYVYCFETLFAYADYFVVNVSSPNTPDLRALQDKTPLTALLSTLQHLNNEKSTPKPILLKIAPDLNESQLIDIVGIIKETKLAGVIATNTTISRKDLKTSAEKIAAIGAGGLSGKPVKAQSTEIIRFLRKHLGKDVVIMGVGGIQTGIDAQEKLDAGADLVQVYSGLVYEGPMMVKRINQYLSKSLKTRSRS